jgi:hypothetical protein
MATPMKTKDYLNTSHISIAFLAMGFIVIVALIFRPQGSISIEFGKDGSSIKIDEARKKSLHP